MVDAATLAPQIAQAKAAGYSDDDIVKHLSQGVPEIKQATDAGYKSDQILGHLTSHALPAITVEEEKTPKPETAPADDHGLARRQQMSPLEQAISPATEWPRNYAEMRSEAEQQMGRGVGQLAAGFGQGLGMEPGSLAGLGTFAKGAGNLGLGALGYIASPVSAAYRSVIGQPVEDVTGIPREQTEFLAQLATPGIGFTRFAKAPGVAEPGPLIRPPAEVPRPVVPEAAERLKPYGVDTPSAITGGPTAQRLGQYVSNVPFAGAPVSEAVHTTLPQQLERARDVIAAEHGEGTGANVANRAGSVLREAASAETKAATDAAAQADAQAAAEWQRAQAEREAAIANREQQSTQATQQAVGPEAAPLDMGDTVIGHVRTAHDAARNAKDTAYREAGAHEGTVFDEAVGSADRHVNMDLRSDQGGQGIVTTTPTLTPAAMEMRQSLRNFSERGRQRQLAAQQEAIDGGGSAADAAQTGINLRTIETQRQELGNMAQGATNDADRRAARRIMGAFDDWHEAAIENHFDGDPGALDAYRNARDLNRDWRQRFGYNNRDDADKLINKIVRGEEDQHTGPVAVSDALTARNDKSGPLFSRVMEATQGHPDVLQAIRSGTWNKLSRAIVDGKERSPEAIQSEIYAHLHGKGRDVADRVFTPEQRDLMHAHADTVVSTAAQRAAAADFAKASKPVPTEVEPGPIQQLANRVVGKGEIKDEALFKTIHGFAQKGGDVKELARFVGQLPQGMRGDLAGSFIRQLGVSPGTKQFSLDHFASQWGKISDQAKAVMFGNAGPHVAALNDIATVSQRLKQVKGRFGNPSGTAQNSIFAAMAALAGQSTIGAVKTGLLGGAGYLGARVLASPAGASSIARYARAVERANSSPTIVNVTSAKLMHRNLQNTAQSLGAFHGEK